MPNVQREETHMAEKLTVESAECKIATVRNVATEVIRGHVEKFTAGRMSGRGAAMCICRILEDVHDVMCYARAWANHVESEEESDG